MTTAAPRPFPSLLAGAAVLTAAILALPPAAAGQMPADARIEQLLERAQRAREQALARAALAQQRALAAAQAADVQRRRRARQLERQRAVQEAREARQRRVREARRDGPSATETIARTLTLRRSGTLEVVNLDGDVRITGGGGDTVRVEAVKRVWNRDEGAAKAQLQDLAVAIAERGDVVEVRTDAPRDRFVNAAVDYTITVPSMAAVVVRAVSGSVRLSGLRGDWRAETVSAGVAASSLGPRSAAKSVSGDVEITGGEGGELTASTVSGALSIRGVRTRTLDVSSVSGPIRAAAESDRVRVRSINGPIEYDGPFARNGRYELQTHSGAITIAPRGAGFAMEATTFSGDIRSELAMTLQDTAAQRGRGSRRVTGTSGDGSASLALRSFSGEIHVRRR